MTDRGKVLKLLLFVLPLCMTLSSCGPRPMKPMIIESKFIEDVSGSAASGAIMRGRVYHEVGPGETVWRISKMYDVPVRDITSANRLDGRARLEIGQKLFIPNGRKDPRAVIPLYDSRPWEYIVIHHSATHFGKALTFNKSHLSRGFTHGLGYHFVISNGTQGKMDGFIEVSPRWIKQSDGAHCKANRMNHRGIGICLVGNFSDRNEKVTKKQMESLLYLVKILQRHYRIPSSKVVGHGKVYGAQTECPGSLFPWKKFNRRLN